MDYKIPTVKEIGEKLASGSMDLHQAIFWLKKHIDEERREGK
jgi:hypothetical protein